MREVRNKNLIDKINTLNMKRFRIPIDLDKIFYTNLGDNGLYGQKSSLIIIYPFQH